MALIFLIFFIFNLLGENKYLRNFPFRAHLRKLIPEEKFFQIDLRKLIRD